MVSQINDITIIAVGSYVVTVIPVAGLLAYKIGIIGIGMVAGKEQFFISRLGYQRNIN